MSEKKTVVEILEEVLEEQHKLFEEAVKSGDIPDLVDLGGEITKTCVALMEAQKQEYIERTFAIRGGGGPITGGGGGNGGPIGGDPVELPEKDNEEL